MCPDVQTPAILVNGQASEYISSLDRGLLYGDGLFETIAVRQGQPQFWDEHLERLKQGCRVLGLASPDCMLLSREVAQLINADKQCVIKVIITRGVGERGYRPGHQSPTRIVQKFPWPDFPAGFTDPGIDVTLCNFRLSLQSRLAQIKHLNRLEQVLARSEWDNEYQEGLVCDTQDHIIEATASNVFFEKGDELITPDLKRCGVAGILRRQVINYCYHHDIELTIRDFSLKEVSGIEAMFVCNSIAGIWPVKRFDTTLFSRSAMTDRLMSVFNN
ncbi:MAG: aminodeoxychorismate lyase [Gammaproteobacteria bacterium]|nr:aminodeoxychorismate lyase [Gammaproteobacteria bacterium]